MPESNNGGDSVPDNDSDSVPDNGSRSVPDNGVNSVPAGDGDKESQETTSDIKEGILVLKNFVPIFIFISLQYCQLS